MSKVVRSDPIGDYTRELRQALRIPSYGPEPDQVTEVRDGLEDAAAAHVRDGLTRLEAERRAVAEFGDPTEIAGLFGVELGARRTFRAALALALLQPLLLGVWAGYSILFPEHHVSWQDGARIGAAFSVVGLISCILATSTAVLLRLRAATQLLPARVIMIGLALLAFASVVIIYTLAALTHNAAPASSIQATAQSAVQVISNLIIIGMFWTGISSVRAARLAHR